MTDPASGPFLFDTSAESYLGRPPSEAEADWFVQYTVSFPMYVAVPSVMERARGYYIAIDSADPVRRAEIRHRMLKYIHSVETGSRVLNLTVPIALVAAQLMSLVLTRPVHLGTAIRPASPAMTASAAGGLTS